MQRATALQSTGHGCAACSRRRGCALSAPLRHSVCAPLRHSVCAPQPRARGVRSGAVCSAQRPGGSLATRLSRLASTLPQRVDLYFERRPLRRYMWCGISGFAGFYVANTVSLSFGALAVNDIVAAALAVTVVELATKAFYSAWPNPPFSLWLLHCFKLGFVYALISDSFKLGG